MADQAALKLRFTPKANKPFNEQVQLSTARYSPCGKLLLGAGYDGQLHRWDVTKDPCATLPAVAGHNGWVSDVAFDRTGTRVASIDSWGALRCWSVGAETLEPAWTHEAAHDGWILGLAIDPAGERVATCGRDRRVRVWSLADGNKQFESAPFASEVFRVLFHPTDGTLAAGDFQGHVFQVDLATGETRRTFDASPLFAVNRLQDVGGVRALAFTTDGSRVLCGGTKPSVGGNVQGTPCVLGFDWQSGELKSTWQLGNGGDVFVFDLLCLADGVVMAVTSGNPGQGKLVIVAQEDGTVIFEDTRLPNPHSLSLHPGGKRLAIAATNGGSNGNGRQLKDGQYANNFSPIHVYELPE